MAMEEIKKRSAAAVVVQTIKGELAGCAQTTNHQKKYNDKKDE